MNKTFVVSFFNLLLKVNVVPEKSDQKNEKHGYSIIFCCCLQRYDRINGNLQTILVSAVTAQLGLVYIIRKYETTIKSSISPQSEFWHRKLTESFPYTLQTEFVPLHQH